MADRGSSRTDVQVKTRLGLFCDKVMEAGWLLAALLVPLYFDIYSNRVFEPDKLSLLRSIALVMGVAWLIAFLEKWAWPGSNRAAPHPGHLSSANKGGWKGLVLQMAERNVLALPTLLLIGALLVSTAASVLPAVSLWGSYVRLQGTYTALAYIVVFFIVASSLRSKAQLERLVFVLIYTSLPISLHGVIQHLKLEFMPWLGDVTARVTSTMGNAIFIGAYLIMVIPITFATFSEKITAFSRELSSEQRGQKGTPWSLAATIIASQSFALTLIVFQALQLYASFKPEGAPFGSLDQAILVLALLLLFTPFVFARRAILRQVECVLLGWILTLQAATVLFSQSRGPMLGLLGGMAVYLVVLAIRRRWRRTLAALLLAGLLGTSFLVVFNLPPVRPGSPGQYRGLLGKPLLAVYNLTHGPLEPLKNVPYLGRLGNLLETEGGTGKVRLLIWEGATKLIQAESLRTLVGYGPETMFLVYPRFYPPDLAHYEARNASPDRSHNEVMDELVTTGLLGYLAYWLVYCAVAFGALKILGLTGTLGFWRAMALGLVAGLLVAALLYTQVLPLAATPPIPLAFFALLLGYWLWPGVNFFTSKEPPNPQGLLLVGLIAAMVAHFIEIQFGIAIAATRTYFWLYAGMVIALGAMAKNLASRPGASPGDLFTSKETCSPPSPKVKGTVRKQPKGMPAKPAGPAVPRWLPAVTFSLVIGAVLTTMLFDFSWPGQQLPALVPWLLGTAWLTLSLGGTFTGKKTEASLLAKETLVQVLALALFWAVVFAWLRLNNAIMPAGEINTAWAGSFFYLWVFFLFLLLAWSLYVQESHVGLPFTNQGRLSLPVYSLLAVAGLLVAVNTNLLPVLADIQFKRGFELYRTGTWERGPETIRAMQQAVRLAPSQDYFYVFLGGSYLEMARRAPSLPNALRPPYLEAALALRPEQVAQMGREDLLRCGAAVLTQAAKINPIYTDNMANLARLYSFWMETTASSEDKPEKFALAEGYYRRATALSPQAAHLYNEWAQLYRAAGRLDDARAKLEQSLRLDPSFGLTYLLMGDWYLAQGQADKAKESFAQAVAMTPALQGEVGRYYLRNGFYQEAIDEYQRALGRGANSFDALSALSYLYDLTGRPAQALPYAQQAARLAPTDSVTRKNLIALYQKLNMLDQAIAEAKAALKIAPNDQGLQALLASLLEKK